MKLSQQQVQHLFWRAGLSDHHLSISSWYGKTSEEIWDYLITEAEDFSSFIIFDKNQFDFQTFKAMSKKEKQILLKESRNQIKELNKKWIDHMLITSNVLRERMSLFWHNHFACSSKNIFFIQSYLNTIRKHALGNFGEMLQAISREPAMLQYLNNQQNRKQNPNENFAREVMELFTIGRGNYTENDVKNAARAFTGWSFNQEGEYVLRIRQHDYGEKELFGKFGNYSGEDVLNMLLQNRHTAKFLTLKIYKYLVNDVPNKERIDQLSEEFYQSGYDIQTLLKGIFLSDWFYDQENMGVKIKSPVDLLVGMCRSTGISFSQAEGPLFIQKHLGQMLLNPPNVAGWPGGKNWIDSSTLLFRTRLMEIVIMSSDVGLEIKESGDVNDQFKLGRLKKLGAEFDLEIMNKNFAGVKGGLKAMKSYLLQTSTSIDSTKINQAANYPFLKQLMEICRTPEYQMC